MTLFCKKFTSGRCNEDLQRLYLSSFAYIAYYVTFSNNHVAMVIILFILCSSIRYVNLISIRDGFDITLQRNFEHVNVY